MQIVVSPDSPLERLAGFLANHPPRLNEILGTVCEVYRTDPDRIDTSTHARRVFCFIASQWAGQARKDIASHAKVHLMQVHYDNQKIGCYVLTDEVLRRRLDLIAVRLTERILMRGDHAKAHP
jgi:hypothetical protein